MAHCLLTDFVPDYDQIFVERLKAADGIVVGKTNVSKYSLVAKLPSSLRRYLKYLRR